MIGEMSMEVATGSIFLMVKIPLLSHLNQELFNYWAKDTTQLIFNSGSKVMCKLIGKWEVLIKLKVDPLIL